jgi:acyl-CoA reductase-like NAD-dependent aldehyde dehydrogenase
MLRLGLNRHLTHYDLLLAANWAALGILYNTGQDCTAGSRVYVQDTIYDKFVTTLAAKAKELVIGDGFDEKSGGGPLVCTSPLPFWSPFHLAFQGL